MACCPACLEKDRQIYELEAELRRIKQKLRWEERKSAEGSFGSSTPSAQQPFKCNGSAANQRRKGGGRKGHVGHGRSGVSSEQAAQVEQLAGMESCPYCQGALEDKGRTKRTIRDIREQALEYTVYQGKKQWCPRCRKAIVRKPPVLPRALYGNQLIAHAVALHFLHGIPCSRIEQLWAGQVPTGSLHRLFHQVAHHWRPALETLIAEYRQAPVKHADETRWRTDGQSGYVWIFCSATVNLFRFAERRSADVPRLVFGTEPLPGTLLVDRYAAYNQILCFIQYCYAHLKRNVEDAGKQFPHEAEVQGFVKTLTRHLGRAIKLRNKDSTDQAFYRCATRLKNKIVAVTTAPARHPAILEIQNIFAKHEQRLYHWARDRTIPADNNRAERELRPTVIARKVSFGSQSKRGADTRSVLTSVLYTVQKRLKASAVDGKLPQSVEQWLKEALDTIVGDPDVCVPDLLPK
jgi:transposase